MHTISDDRRIDAPLPDGWIIEDLYGNPIDCDVITIIDENINVSGLDTRGGL